MKPSTMLLRAIRGCGREKASFAKRPAGESADNGRDEQHATDNGDQRAGGVAPPAALVCTVIGISDALS